MPKYTFKCETCELEKQYLTSVSTTDKVCPVCFNSMVRQMPTIAGQQLFETVNSFTNVQWTKDQKDEIQERRDTHYWEIEVPKLIETYSLETCIENKWLVYNEKGELIINNKPPKKR